MIHLSRVLTAAAALLVLTWTGAQVPASAADESRLLSDRGGFSVGGFLVDFNTDIQAGKSNLGTSIDLEDDLLLETDKSTFRIDGFFRFAPTHALDAGFFSIGRNGTAILDKQIEFNDVIYGPGRVDSEFDVNLFRVAYRHSFVNTGKTEAGFTAGLSTYDFSAMLDGTVIIDQGLPTEREVTAREEASVVAPVPTVGMFVHHAFLPNLIFKLDANFFRLASISDYSGRLTDTRVTLDWFFVRNVGIGGGINNTDLRFAKETGDTFSVNYVQSGFLGYFTFAF